jgi:hypothetical protein
VVSPALAFRQGGTASNDVRVPAGDGGSVSPGVPVTAPVQLRPKPMLRSSLVAATEGVRVNEGNLKHAANAACLLNESETNTSLRQRDGG